MSVIIIIIIITTDGPIIIAALCQTVTLYAIAHCSPLPLFPPLYAPVRPQNTSQCPVLEKSSPVFFL
jgi:hypothetical protein